MSLLDKAKQKLSYQNPYGIHPFVWLWLPILWMAGQIAAELIFSKEALLRFHSENGMHEWLQFAMMIGVFIIAMRTLISMDRKKSPFLVGWMLAAAIGSFYVAMEEISWGQWIFNWSTPEHFEEINYQNETNLHNTSKWLNQKPRLLLEVGVIAGGILIPLLHWIKPSWLPKRFKIIYPPNFMCVIACVYVLGKFSQKFSRMAFDTKIFARSSEIEELYIYFFVFLYMIIMHKRITGKS